MTALRYRKKDGVFRRLHNTTTLKVDTKCPVWQILYCTFLKTFAPYCSNRVLKMETTETWRLFWAKTDRTKDEQGNLVNPDWTRPLWAHLIDVAHTALLLWEGFIPDVFRRKLAGALGLSTEDTGRLLSLWIGLHDLGKAIPTFQALHGPSKKRLCNAGFTFQFLKPRHHGHASIGILYQWLQMHSHDAATAEGYEHIGAFVGYHHGRLYPKHKWQDDAENPNVLGDDRWTQARFALLDRVQDTWHTRYPHARPAQFDPIAPWMLGFAGWASLADWLGSMAECFPHDVDSNLDVYLNQSRAGAEHALHKAGFDAPAHLTFQSFGAHFPKLAAFEPRPLQAFALDDTHPLPDGPTLTIIEAPTGEGKTEAALILATRQQDLSDTTGRGGGLYIAMPTQATSNGLFDRVVAFLNQAHQGGPANFRLVHGNADLHEGQQDLFVQPERLEEVYDNQDPRARIQTARWFLNRKRALLAPYGIGTVDQAFLGVLYAKHFFLRLFGLAGKTVIFDEVHAYDFYMNRLFRQLLTWLRTLNTHVILLSATLPAVMRNQLIRAWGAAPPKTAPTEVPYPSYLDRC